MATRENLCCPACLNRWLMSQDVVKEAYFFAGSVLMGIAITFSYDFLLISRRIVKHSLWGISVEDLLFWVTCSIVVFYMLYKENNGILRWFAVLGAAFGMLLYKRIIGLRFVNLMAAVIQKELQLIGKIVGFLLKPFRWIGKGIKTQLKIGGRKKKKWDKFWRNQLTKLKKVLKISLTKH